MRRTRAGKGPLNAAETRLNLTKGNQGKGAVVPIADTELERHRAVAQARTRQTKLSQGTTRQWGGSSEAGWGRPGLTGTRVGAAMRRGSSGSGRVRCGAGQGSVARGLAGKTGHGWGWTDTEL